RAMGKKKPEEMNKYKQIFLDGASAKNINQKVAEELFEMMVAFAEYCFNKSHSAAYAVISYQTAWLKANYPVQYLAALMSSVRDDQDKVRFYIAEAKRMVIKILPPDVNVSGLDFTADPANNQILFGLAAIKNVGENAIHEIIRARNESGKFICLKELCKRVDLKAVNRRALESLIRCGAFAAVSGNSRKSLLDNLDSILSQSIREKERELQGQTSLFGSLLGGGSEDSESEVFQESDSIKDCEEFDKEDIQKLEKELLGFYVTSHPLADSMKVLNYFSTHTLSELSEVSDGAEVVVPVLLSQLTKRMTKTNRLIGIGVIEDMITKIEAVFFSRVLEEAGELLKEDAKLLLKGKVQVKSEGEISLSVDSVREIKNLSYISAKVVNPEAVGVDWQTRLMSFRNALKQYSGNCPVILHYNSKKALVDPKLWVLENVVGELKSFEWLEPELVKVG
ncbi:MAG: hypothetical protein SFU25_07410, partial [Candidatus Caenarcaniphilales bacterium]|nr:hypothetical protein [Candidatus Caenarcaniphilales bacterium]